MGDAMGTVVGVDFGSLTCRAAAARDGHVEIFANRFASRQLPLDVEFPVPDADRPWQPPIRFYSWKQRIGLVDPLSSQQIARAAGDARELFRQIYEDAVEALGGSIQGAVAAVPGCFAERQRLALREAVEAGGFRTAKLVDEPLAAVLGSPPCNGRARVLVVSWGASMLSCALVQMGRPLKAFPSEGTRELGGLDFEALLIGSILRKLSLTRADFVARHDSPLQLRALAERVKIGLSKRSEEQFDIPWPSLFSDAPHGATPTGVSVTVTRSEFEESIRPLVEAALSYARTAAEQAGLPPDCILLVGGSTRVPLVGQRLAEEFGVPLIPAADSAIARGAAIYGSGLEESAWRAARQPVAPPSPLAAPAPQAPPDTPAPRPAPAASGRWIRAFEKGFADAETYWSKGERALGIVAFEGVVADAKRFLGNLHYQWGESLFRDEKPVEAVSQLELALHYVPDDRFALESYHHSLNGKARALLREGRYIEARAAIRLGLSLKPDCEPCQGLARQIDEGLRGRLPESGKSKHEKKGRRR